jgi:excisionase family DNA binding protein
MNSEIKRLFNDYLKLTDDKVAAANLVLADILSGHSFSEQGGLSVSEAAQQLRCSTHTIYRLCENGKLPNYRIGDGRGVIRIRIADLAECQNIVRALPVDMRSKRRR